MNDLKFAFRQLRKNPGFTAIAVVTLGLGIGANTAIFSVVNAILLHPLPYQDPDRLVRIASVNPNLGIVDSRSSGLNVLDWQRQCKSFESIAAYQEWDGILTFKGKSEPARVNWITPNLLPMLGLTPIVGGSLSKDEATTPGLLLPFGVWKSRFGGDVSVIGQPIVEDGTPSVITGILPPSVAVPAQGALPVDQAFVRLNLPQLTYPRDWQLFNVIARLKPGVSVAQAQAELSGIAAHLEKLYPASNRGWSVKVTNLKEWMFAPVREQLWIVYAATAVILLIACLNVSNLLLVRGAARRKELALRYALGSTRGRLLRHLLAESLMLAVFGGVAGLFVAMAGRRILLGLAPDSLGLHQGSLFDWMALTSAVVISVLAALVFGLFPAVRVSQRNLGLALVETGRSISAVKGRHRLLNGLVAGQIAISTILLVAAGLAIVSFQKLTRVDPGFATQNSVCFRVGLVPDQQTGERVLEAISNVPGVQHVGGAHIELLNDVFSNPVRITIDGRPESTGETGSTVNFWLVTKDYFSALGTPILAGRPFNARDTTNAPSVAIINEALAKRYFPNEDPIGKFIRIPDTKNGKAGTARQIVGVVGSIRQHGLREAPVPILYVHYTSFGTGSVALTVRTTGNSTTLLPAIRAAVQNVNPELLMTRVSTAEKIVARSFGGQRFATLLMFVFAALGTMLAAVGLYGVLAYTVSQRTQEIGIRLALGAQRAHVLGMILREGMALVTLGIVVGLAGAAAFGHLVRSLLFNVSPTDPLTFSFIPIFLCVITLLACWLPARRATRVNPIEALRCE